MFEGRAVTEETTLGIDIGTTSIKGVAVDGDGNVVDRIRLPHPLNIPAPDRMEHDAGQAWRRGPRRAWQRLRQHRPRAVAVSAMVPSLTAVDRRGIPRTPGLLYGDARGRVRSHGAPGQSGEAVEFLRWTAAQAPGAAGYWPGQAVAAYALTGRAVVDIGTAFTMAPLFGPAGTWDLDVCAALGVDPRTLPDIEMPGIEVGHLDDGTVMAAGSIDVMGEQIVAGADHIGDVLVLCGTTMIIWAVVAEPVEVPGLWTVPHTAAGKTVIGGPSNAGGLFLNWVDRLVGRARRPLNELNPDRIPVFAPYIRGERTPLHDPDRRAVLDGLDLTHDPGAVRRAGYEAAGFVVRHHIDLAMVDPRRIVATGGGTRDPGWMQALADCTGLPVHVADVPEGAALGAAFLARQAAGLETSMADAARWARTGRIVEPDARWHSAAAARYERFRTLTGPPGQASAVPG